MPESPSAKRNSSGEGEIYQIKIRGYLDYSWSERLAGMTIKNDCQNHQITTTTLTGQVRDQAELAGVLNSLYELHYPILSVEIMNEPIKSTNGQLN